jgi:hypothetical protein
VMTCPPDSTTCQICALPPGTTVIIAPPGVCIILCDP